WLKRFEIHIYGCRDLFGLLGEQDMANAGTDCHFRSLPNAHAHRGRRLVSQQEALGVFRVTDAIVEEIPVQPVHACLAGMATRAALPALETDARVVKVELALAGKRQAAWLERRKEPLRVG